MPDLSLHDIITVALFLTMLLLLAIASFINGRNTRRSFAVLALATGAAASIGIATRPPGASTWAPTNLPEHAGLNKSSNRGGASFGGLGLAPTDTFGATSSGD